MIKLSDDFTAQMRHILPDECDALLEAITTTDPSVAIRVNDGRGISLSGDAVGRVPWCTTGRYLKERMPFTFDVDFQTGRYYVQDASSMFIHHVIKHVVKEPVRYLDLCAAPGKPPQPYQRCLPIRWWWRTKLCLRVRVCCMRIS